MSQFSILFSVATLQSTNGDKQALSDTVFLYAHIHVLHWRGSLAVSQGVTYDSVVWVLVGVVESAEAV